MPSHIQRCKENIANGRKPYLIVPVEKVEKAKAYAEAEHVESKVAIVSIEQFVGQNIDELGEFDHVKIKLAEMLREYNDRVADAETDHSIQIVIPKNIDPER
jgi:hypothetical protein